MTPEDETLPAIDNEDIRKLNTKKIVSSIEKIGESMDEQRKTAKWTGYYLIVMILLIVFIVVGSYVYVATKSSSVGAFFDYIFYTENVNTRLNCTFQDTSMIFRTPEEGYYFKQIFDGADCKLEMKADE